MICLSVNILNLYILIVYFRQQTYNCRLFERGVPNLVGNPLPSQTHMPRCPPKMGWEPCWEGLWPLDLVRDNLLKSCRLFLSQLKSVGNSIDFVAKQAKWRYWSRIVFLPFPFPETKSGLKYYNTTILNLN